MLELGRDERVLERYPEILLEVLGRSEQELWLKKETLITDRKRIKRNEATDDVRKLTLDMLCNAEGRSLVVSLAELPGKGCEAGKPRGVNRNRLPSCHERTGS